MAARTSPRVTEAIVFAIAAVPQNLTHVAGLLRVPGPAGPEGSQHLVNLGDDDVLEHGRPA